MDDMNRKAIAETERLLLAKLQDLPNALRKDCTSIPPQSRVLRPPVRGREARPFYYDAVKIMKSVAAESQWNANEVFIGSTGPLATISPCCYTGITEPSTLTRILSLG